MYNLSARERNKMGKNGNLFYHEKMSKKVGVGRFLSIFQKLQNS
jgi:hypothetical protein